MNARKAIVMTTTPRPPKIRPKAQIGVTLNDSPPRGELNTAGVLSSEQTGQQQETTYNA
jgi:hypothetical protein